jgi:hypothetical protein
MLKTTLADGRGAGHEVAVLSDNSLLVTPNLYNPLPPPGTNSQLRFYSGYLGTTGIDSGTLNANVNGSVTQEKFYLASSLTYDIRITKLLIYIQDGTVSHSGFGALAALTNGIDIVAIEGAEETYLVKSAKTFADLITQTFAERPFGGDATSFELSSVSGSEDAQVLPYDLGAIIPNGIRIGRGGIDRLELRVNDNLTALTTFNVRVAGYRHYPLAGE